MNGALESISCRDTSGDGPDFGQIWEDLSFRICTGGRPSMPAISIAVLLIDTTASRAESVRRNRRDRRVDLFQRHRSHGRRQAPAVPRDRV